MPDSERFQGIADALAEADEFRLRANQGGKTSSSSLDNVNTPPSEASQTRHGDPAFSFDATTAHSIYVRPETLDMVDDVEALVDARLRTERNIRDLTTREFYDAALRVAVTEPDRLLEEVLATRARKDETLD